jgi:hypothetical protein
LLTQKQRTFLDSSDPHSFHGQIAAATQSNAGEIGLGAQTRHQVTAQQLIAD